MAGGGGAPLRKKGGSVPCITVRAWRQFSTTLISWLPPYSPSSVQGMGFSAVNFRWEAWKESTAPDWGGLLSDKGLEAVSEVGDAGGLADQNDLKQTVIQHHPGL